ncbi:hypothetical protein N7540_012257 [Penicillium herquei]|nr:hypothetical protein N7540_012257 [Penicillium herquei]
MLPESLRSSYTRYKDDTNTFATWLLEAASKCGYQPDDLTSTTPLNSETSKNKNKKKQANTYSGSVQYITTVKNLQVLADVVAKSSLTVPRPIIAIAKRAIKLRKNVTSWFLGKGDAKNNERHAYFVSALERVCETLEWKATKSPKPDTKQPSQTSASKDGDADLDTFLNRFAVLTVEEPTEAHSSGQKEPVTSNSHKIVKVELVENNEDEEENNQDHMFFKVLCLFEDLRSMREFISNTWLEYRDKKIDLMNAALVTDGALKLAKSLVQEVEEAWAAYPLSSEYTILDYAFWTAGVALNIPSPPPGEIADSFLFRKDVMDAADLCYFRTFSILISFSPLLENNRLRLMKKSHFGVYNPKANREMMSPDQKIIEDRIIIFELLPEFWMISRFSYTLPVSDSITEGLVEYVKTKRADLWLCFASQIYLDIHHIMRQSPLSAFDDLKISALRIQKTIDEFLEFSDFHTLPGGINRLRNAMDLFSKEGWDWLGQKRSAYFPKMGPVEKQFLYSRSPIFCGLSLFGYNLQMQNYGQLLVNQWYDVQSVAFLYNLVNVQSRKNMEWPDMETFIKIHGESHIFVGSRPKNASESLNRFDLAIGISSAARFARDARNRPSFRPDRKVVRILKLTTTISAMLGAGYMAGPQSDGSFKFGISVGNIEEILDKLSQELSPKSTGMGLPSSNPQVMFQQKWSRSQKIDILQFLALMKSRLAEEEPMFLFNYFGLHQRCITILGCIERMEYQELGQNSDSSYIRACKGRLVSNIAVLVLEIARNTEKSVQSLRFATPVGSNNHIACQIVMRCAQVMKAYLQQNGDVACKELRVFCKNKKPIYDAIDCDTDSSDLDDYYWVDIEKTMTMDPKTLASLETGIPVA